MGVRVAASAAGDGANVLHWCAHCHVPARAIAASFSAPPTPFNGPLGRLRNIAYTQLDMRDVKRVRIRFGVTINDVVVALLCRATALPKRRARAVGGHRAIFGTRSDRPGRNQATWMFCRVPSQVSDPAQRIAPSPRKHRR